MPPPLGERSHTDVPADRSPWLKVPENIVARQLERTDHTNKCITNATRQTVLEAGLALQKAGVIKPDVDVKAATEALIDTHYAA